MYASRRRFLSEASLYPDEYLSEVAAKDMENVRHRIRNRKALLDTALKRSAAFGAGIAKQSVQSGTAEIAMKEPDLWRAILQLEPSIMESSKAILLHDRIWSLRSHIDKAAWQALVIESGIAALAGEQAVGAPSPRVAALLRFRLGYTYLRAGRIEDGMRMYEEMFEKIALYQKELQDNYDRVQWAQTKEKIASGAKTALAGTLSGLSWAIEGAGRVSSLFIPGVGVLAFNQEFTKSGYVIGTYAPGLVSATTSSIVNAANPGVERSVQEFQSVRYKSFETMRLFGETPRALPLLLNEHELFELYLDLGAGFERQGRIRQAIDQYKNAIEIIEQERAGLGKERTRLSFLEGKEEVYERVIHLLVKVGDPVDAFGYSERARSRNFIDILASETPKFHTSRESAAFNQRQREQAEVDLAVQRSGLTRFEIDQIRRNARGVQVTPDKALLHSTDDQPLSVEFDSLTSVTTSSINEISKQLGRDAAMLSFYVADDYTVVFLLQEGNISAWSRSVGRASLQGKVEAFRQLIQENPKDPKNRREQISALSKAGQDFFRLLLQDTTPTIRKPIVYLSPHGPLHYLPFAALHDGSKYLADRFTLLTVPSGTVLTYLGKKPRASTGATVVLANPDLGDSAFDLPFAEQEADAIKRHRPEAMILKGKDAQEAKLRKLGPKEGVLHFATHGKFTHGRPLDSALLLAPGSGEDGTLTAGEIFGLNLPGSLVVLSACETGLSQLATGDEILGLTRAFMYAGVPQLITTLWEIDDQATSELMNELYETLGIESAPAALRTAQLKIRSRYPHPFYWAGFVSVGVYQ
jgi:CHAT domain-containing protein